MTVNKLLTWHSFQAVFEAFYRSKKQYLGVVLAFYFIVISHLQSDFFS